MLDSSEKVEEVKKVLFLDKEQTTFATAVQGSLDRDDIDPTWIIGLATLPGLKRKRIGVARLRQPLSLTIDASSVYFVILVISPSVEVCDSNYLTPALLFTVSS